MDIPRAAAGGASPADGDVTASEAATYVFCAKAWHLERVLGRPPGAPALERRAQGSVGHAAHGARVGELQRLGPWLARGSVALLVLAAILLVAALLVALWR